jgi:hypothetical protein
MTHFGAVRWGPTTISFCQTASTNKKKDLSCGIQTNNMHRGIFSKGHQIPYETFYLDTNYRLVASCVHGNATVEGELITCGWVLVKPKSPKNPCIIKCKPSCEYQDLSFPGHQIPSICITRKSELSFYIHIQAYSNERRRLLCDYTFPLNWLFLHWTFSCPKSLKFWAAVCVPNSKKEKKRSLNFTWKRNMVQIYSDLPIPLIWNAKE